MAHQQAKAADRDAADGNPLGGGELAQSPRVGPEHFDPEAPQRIGNQIEQNGITLT